MPCLGLAGGSLLAVITSRIFYLDNPGRWFDCAFASFTLWSAIFLLLPTLSSDQQDPLWIGLVVAVVASSAAMVGTPYGNGASKRKSPRLAKPASSRN
jgi:hypothetical protein